MKRLEALDVMRGLTIMLMIMVNAGLWGTPIFHSLHHALWNGLTPADLVFPFFMFIMGVSISFSFKQYGYQWNILAEKKILKRTLLIYFIGVLLDYAEKLIGGEIQPLDFSEVRLTGVLPRLALSYGVAATLVLVATTKTLWRLSFVLLVLYGAILLLFNGFEANEFNIVSKVDLFLVGSSHMYHDWGPEGRIPLDPEGFLGLIPSIAHVMIGYLLGRKLQAGSQHDIQPLLLIGSLICFIGFIFCDLVPLNKKVWSPTFVLITCGMASQLLGMFVYWIDIRNKKGAWVQPFIVFGVNPLALYILSSLIGALLWLIKFPEWLYSSILSPIFGENSAVPSLIYSLFVVAICFGAGSVLYKRKIFIKI